MAIETTSRVLQALRDAARAAHPRECCGLLLGEIGGGDARITQVVPTANVASDPLHRFEIDPAALIAAHRQARAGGPAVLGYYHSHPSGVAVPSATDKAGAARDGQIWAIVAGEDIGWWHDGEAGFAAIIPRID